MRKAATKGIKQTGRKPQPLFNNKWLVFIFLNSIYYKLLPKVKFKGNTFNKEFHSRDMTRF